MPFASNVLAGPDVGDNLLMAGAELARTGDAGCWIWIVLISAVVVVVVAGVGLGVTWVIL